MLDKAMAKHEACAAARSSSGLVMPATLDDLAAHVTCVCWKAPLSKLTTPLPWKRSPSQTALALLTTDGMGYPVSIYFYMLCFYLHGLGPSFLC
jgi:hypothetical protein